MQNLLFTDASPADSVFNLADIMEGSSLKSLILLSLFTDCRATLADELPAELSASGDLRGWWGDAVDADGETIGSKMWLLNREKNLDATAQRAEQYAREALQWLITDGICAAVSVSVTRQKNGMMTISVKLSGLASSYADAVDFYTFDI